MADLDTDGYTLEFGAAEVGRADSFPEPLSLTSRSEADNEQSSSALRLWTATGALHI